MIKTDKTNSMTETIAILQKELDEATTIDNLQRDIETLEIKILDSYDGTPDMAGDDICNKVVREFWRKQIANMRKQIKSQQSFWNSDIILT
tara:strand:+ start:1566 stop:1838 length:273 start_codon:yes stop_codon:yes gene_type:complete